MLRAAGGLCVRLSHQVAPDTAILVSNRANVISSHCANRFAPLQAADKIARFKDLGQHMPPTTRRGTPLAWSCQMIIGTAYVERCEGIAGAAIDHDAILNHHSGEETCQNCCY
jgi:hypothetical protein